MKTLILLTLIIFSCGNYKKPQQRFALMVIDTIVCDSGFLIKPLLVNENSDLSITIRNGEGFDFNIGVSIRNDTCFMYQIYEKQ